LDGYAQAETIKVEIRTLKMLGGVQNEAMPGVEVRIGNKSVKTDVRGRGVLMVVAGTNIAAITAPCPVYSINAIGSVAKSGGSNQEPVFNFPFPSNQSPTITFLMRCDSDVTPGKSRVKIATTTSCKDDPNGGMTVQAGISVMIGDKEYTSNEKGVIDIDLPPGRYPVMARWKDYAFGYVAQNGIRVPIPEGGLPAVEVAAQQETLEVRIFTCDETGQAKARAVITEIGSQIWVKRSKASGNAFVGMYLRDGDLVEVTGAAAIKWLKPEGTIAFEKSARFYIRPDERPPAEMKQKRMSAFEVLQGIGHFLIPSTDDDAEYDENGNRVKFKASSHSIAVGVKGTVFTFGHDEATQKSAISVTEGVVAITPKYPEMARFELTAGQRAEVSPSGKSLGGAKETRISFRRPDLIPRGVGIRVGEKNALFGDSMSTEITLSAPGNYPLKLTGNDLCRIASAEIHGKDSAINISGIPDSPTIVLGPDPWPQYNVDLKVICDGSAPGGDNSLVKPTKAVFGVNERITIDYFNSKGSGWDWVVVVQPSKIIHAPGSHSAVTTKHALQFNAANNSPKEYKGMANFPELPEGKYEARYVSWDGGNNVPIARVPFRVGNAPASPPTGPGAASPATPPPAAPRWNLTGLWRNPGGEGIYRVRQIEAKVVWGLDATSLGSVANMFQGQMSGDNVDGVWEDLPGSATIGGGRMLLKVESDCRFVRVSSVNQYGADVWVKKDSPCDRQTGGTAAGSPVTALGPLSGLWRNPGGDAIYRFRHVGSKLHWGVDAVPIRSFANTFQGEVSGTTIEGSWVDLPGSPAISGGKLSLKIESECRIVKSGETGHYAAQVWVRKDSLCDVTGMQNTAQTPSTKPKVEPIPSDAVTPQPARNNPPVVVVTDPTATAKNPPPKVEPIPGNEVASVPNRPRTPPRVEPIPGEVVASVPTTPRTPPRVEPIPQSTARETPARTTPERTQPTPQPEKTPKPKKEGPGLLERITAAINTAAKSMPQQQPPTTGGGTQQPDGSCRGGSYWIGAPASPRTTGFQIPWSMPFGSGGHHWRVYRAGTSQHVTNNDQPQNANACGLSWHFYLGAGQYDVYLFPGTFANTWNTSTRPVAGPIRLIVN